MISEFIPRYYADTVEFTALAEAYDTVIQPLLDAIGTVFRNCRAPIHMSKDELLPILLAAGYDEAKNMEEDDMRDLFLDILKNRRLMTEAAFVKQLRRAFETEEGETDAWKMCVERYKNVSVVVDTPIESLDRKTSKYTNAATLVYDVLAKNIMLSFPAGVRLKLNAIMQDLHTMYVGVVGTITIELSSTVNVQQNAKYLYDNAHIRGLYEYNEVEDKYNINGEWVSTSDLASVNMSLTSVYDGRFIAANVDDPTLWSFPPQGNYQWLKDMDGTKIDAPYVMSISKIYRGGLALPSSVWSDADYDLRLGVGIPNTGDTGLIRLNAYDIILSNIENKGGMWVTFNAYIPIEDVVNITVRRRSDNMEFDAQAVRKGQSVYYFVRDGVQTRWTNNLGIIGYIHDNEQVQFYNSKTDEYDVYLYDDIADAYSTDGVNWTDAGDFYDQYYELRFGYTTGASNRGPSPQVALFKLPIDYTVDRQYMVVIPYYDLENKSGAIKRAMAKLGDTPEAVEEMIEDALNNQGIFGREDFTYQEALTVVNTIKENTTTVNAYIVPFYYYPNEPFKYYEFAYVDDGFWYDGVKRRTYGIKGIGWMPMEMMHDDDLLYTSEPATPVDMWVISTGRKIIEQCFKLSENDEDASRAGMYWVGDGYGWIPEDELASSDLTLVEPEPEDIEIWYLRNNDERNYDIRRDNAAPSIYKDGSNKTEFGKTYEVLELRKVNGDLVDVEQDGIEKPVNAVCPTVLSGDVPNNQVTMYYRWYGNSTYISAYTVKVRVLDYLTLYTTQYANAVRNYGDVTVANGTTLGIRQRGEGDSGRIPDMYKVGYLYNIIGVFKDNGTEIDKTGLSVINSGGYFYVKNESGSDVSFNHLRLKFEIDPDPTYTAYSRSASYQSSNSTLNTTSYASIYEPGSNNAVAGDTHKDYIITGMWNAAGTDVYKEGVSLSCYLYSGNPRIRIRNTSGSEIAWNRIEYVARDVFRIFLTQTHIDVKLNEYSQMNGCYNRNGSTAMMRAANETYTVIAAYQADGTPVDITPLQVNYNSSLGNLNVKNAGGYGSRTVAYVDFTVSGGDAPTTATMMSEE